MHLLVVNILKNLKIFRGGIPSFRNLLKDAIYRKKPKKRNSFLFSMFFCKYMSDQSQKQQIT